MDERDRQSTIARYESRLAQYGYSPESLGWGKNGKQEIRFAVLAEYAVSHPEVSVLDVGCGFADLSEHLHARGWRGRYTGIDVVPGLLTIARQRHPDLDLRELDITRSSLEPHDVVVASGIANTRLQHGQQPAYIEAILKALVAHARIVAAMDFLSTYVDFQAEGAWHTEPEWAFGVAKGLSRRVALRHDYLPFEFAVLIYRDDDVTPENAYGGFEAR